MNDPIERQDAIEVVKRQRKISWDKWHETRPSAERIIEDLKELPSAQPDDDRLERCRFEYVNACKILAHRTPDTSKSDIYDAHAVIKALHPIFGDVEF